MSLWLFALLIAINLPFNPFALRNAKIVFNFGLSECNRVSARDETQFANSIDPD